MGQKSNSKKANRQAKNASYFKDGFKSKYAIKKQRQANGHYSPNSPISCKTVG